VRDEEDEEGMEGCSEASPGEPGDELPEAFDPPSFRTKRLTTEEGLKIVFHARVALALQEGLKALHRKP